MKVGLDEVEHVSRLARIRLKEQEISKFSKELSSILEYMELLDELETRDVSPTVHTLSITNALRADNNRPSVSQKEALLNAPSVSNGMFSVPKVIE